MKMKWLLLVGLLGLFGGGYGYYMYNKPVESLENVRSDHEIAAKDLLAKYEIDESKANELYLDQVLEVSGEVAKIEAEEGGKTSIYLDTGSMMSSIICELDDRSSANGISVGDNVTIKGLCSGYLMDVVLVRSIIINQ